jgi:hypothetical protein
LSALSQPERAFLFQWDGARHLAAIFIELAVSAAVLGAFAPRPVCRARLGTEQGAPAAVTLSHVLSCVRRRPAEALMESLPEFR